MVVPIGNELPDGRLLVTETAPQESIATGSDQIADAVQAPGATVRVWFPGTPMSTGGFWSRIVTVKDEIALFPARSVAV